MESTSSTESPQGSGWPEEGKDIAVDQVAPDFPIIDSERLVNKESSSAVFGDNVVIAGGQFISAQTMHVISNDHENVMGTTKRIGFKNLQWRVATSAFHDSVQRVDPPKCHPDIRIAILQKIYEWIVHSEHCDEWLLWLNGAAGAGKSAIMQSIAERCAQAAIAIASFFFFRTDPTRNSVTPLIPTLVYQLIQAVPETTEDILLTIEHDPLVFDKSLGYQIERPLIQPLLHLPAHLQRLFVVFIDGLDECNNRVHQTNLINVLGQIPSGKNSPVIFLLASRREPQIHAEFQKKQVCSLLEIIALDDIQASDDIRQFLNDKFEEIKATHLRRHLLPPDWPPASMVEAIATKSSGQFIFASVVINYVSSHRANPARQLDIIKDITLRDPSSAHPFAHLDSLYRHIFSQVERRDIVLDILAFFILTKNGDIDYHRQSSTYMRRTSTCNANGSGALLSYAARQYSPLFETRRMVGKAG